MTKKLSVLLLGAGSMGGAMLRGWLSAGLLDTVRSAVVDPMLGDEMAKLCAEHNLTVNPVEDQAYDICVLAVKPQLFANVLPGLSWPDIQKTLFISIAAGQSLETIRNHLKSAEAGSAPIIRTMPNLPASIDQGVTLLYAEDNVLKDHRDAATQLTDAVGKSVWLDKEDEIDTVGAITGCGPAYVFLLAEAMAEACAAAGYSPELSYVLAEQTVVGAAALLASDGRSAEELRISVTSPGGTTQAALSVLDHKDGFRTLMKKAVKEAAQRSKELEG